MAPTCAATTAASSASARSETEMTASATRISPAAIMRIAKQPSRDARSEEHTSELQSQFHLVCRLLLEKKECSSGEVIQQNLTLTAIHRLSHCTMPAFAVSVPPI